MTKRAYNRLAATRTANAVQGLTPEQRLKVLALLPVTRESGESWGRGRNGSREGWSIYREPTTINPPTTLRLHKRDSNGKLVQVISITEKGVTK